MSEEANLRVRENQTAKQIVLQIAFHYATEWFFNQTAPGLAVCHRLRRSNAGNLPFATSGSSIVSQTFSAKTRTKP